MRPAGLAVLALLALLAAIFTIGLTFASVELPRFAAQLMLEHLETPGFDATYHPDETDAFLTAHHLRLIGAVGLALTVALIAGGIIAERRGVAVAGAALFFLPVFGHFAASMFFLAGLAMLRVVWLPILNVSSELMALGDIVYLPYAGVVYPFVVAGWDIRDGLPWVVMGVGSAIFVVSTLIWLVARSDDRTVADNWLYRLSRHPQYLGWIVWSYGLLLYVLRHSELYQFKIAWGMPSSLPWLVATLVIVGVAMIEEIRMTAAAGGEYLEYRDRTPFLVPLPGWAARLISAPMRWVIRRPWPENGFQIAVAIAVYAFILIGASIPFVVFDWPPRIGWWGFPYNVWPLAG
jgi:protein-S-isoprenylcysteine O-methyltransferase Ste14